MQLVSGQWLYIATTCVSRGTFFMSVVRLSHYSDLRVRRI